MLNNALVDALVTAAGKNNVLFLGKLFCKRLVERSTGWGRENDGWSSIGNQIVECLAPRLRLHNHASTATIRRVVYGLVDVVGPAAKIVCLESDQPLLLGFAQKGKF